MKIIENLKKVRKLISKPENWIKGRNARTADNETCLATSDKACKFCIEGAIIHTVKDIHELYTAPYIDLYMIISPVLSKTYGFNGQIDIFNDDDATTHQEVLNLIDLTIQTETEKEKNAKP